MADFQSPGTKVTTKRKGALTKIGVATAIGGFQGVTTKGTLDTPTLVSGISDFEEVFGARITSRPEVWDDVNAFFLNGGKSCYINRTAGAGSAAATRVLTTTGPAGYGSVSSSAGPWTLVNGDTVILSVDGGGPLTATFNATAATFTLTGGSYAGGAGGDSITLTINGVPGDQVIDLSTAGASQAGYVIAINNGLIGARAAVSGPDIVITTDKVGSGAGGSIASTTCAAKIHPGVLGAFTNAGPNNVADIRAVTAAEAVLVFEAAFTGTTTTASSGNVLTTTVDVAGAGHSVQVSAASSAEVKMGLDTLLHAGTASTSVNTVTVTASSPGAWGNSTGVKATKVDTTVTTVSATSAGSTSTISVLSAVKLQVGDQISITKGGDVQRGVISSINGNTLTLVSAITVPGGGYAGSESVVLETWDLTLYTSSGAVIAPSPFRNLRCSDLAGARYYGVAVNDTSRTPVTLTNMSPVASDPRPNTDSLAVNMAAGSDGAAAAAADYIGSDGNPKTGIYAWKKVSDVNFISISGIADILGDSNGALVLKSFETYLENRGDVQGIIAGRSAENHTDMKTFITTTCNFYSRFLTFIWPHIYMIDAALGVKRLKSPTGAFQGIIARTHANQHFAAAPAGTENGIVASCLGLEYEIQENSAEYDSVFPYGLNAIINMPGEGYVVFGDTTLDSTKEFDEHGEVTGFCVATREARALTRFVNFRPNSEATRGQVVQVLTALFRGWQVKGILAGTEDDEGFFIQCDETNNTALVIAQNKLICRIGLAFQHPARFVDITLEQDTRAIEEALASS